MPADKSFYSSAFSKIILARQAENGQMPLPSYRSALTLQLFAPTVRQDEVVALAGTMTPHAWSIDEAFIMNDSHFPLWEIVLDALSLKYPIEYKFLILKKDTHEVVTWEEGNNRMLKIPEIGKGENVILGGLHWNAPLPMWRGAGVAIPVFSLRSEKSWGIGEFFDLKKW